MADGAKAVWGFCVCVFVWERMPAFCSSSDLCSLPSTWNSALSCILYLCDNGTAFECCLQFCQGEKDISSWAWLCKPDGTFDHVTSDAEITACAKSPKVTVTASCRSTDPVYLITFIVTMGKEHWWATWLEKSHTGANFPTHTPFKEHFTLFSIDRRSLQVRCTFKLTFRKNRDEFQYWLII